MIGRIIGASLIFTCRCGRPEFLQDCKEALTSTRFAKLESGYQRCLRLEAKREAIKADFEAQERRTIEERLLYFAYWEAFTEEQLTEFRKDEAFNHKYEYYLREKQVWEEE